MPGPYRLWSSFSAVAAFRSLVLINEIRGAFQSVSSHFCQACVSENRPVACSTLITRILSSARERTLSSEGVGLKLHRISVSHLPSQFKSELYRRGTYCPNSASLTVGSFCQGLRFASSTSYAVQLPRKEQREGQGNVRPRSHGKRTSKSKISQAGAVVARKGRPAFRGALSSIKGLQSEQGRRNSRPSLARGAARKGAILSPVRKNSLNTTRTKFKDRPADEGLKLKRKRKRIKPRPRDVTYKRGLDSDILNTAADIAEQTPTVEKPPSLNVQFRQIQPSRELIAFIEENSLGRRRLAKWRERGYDPKRTQPLDDLPDGKTKRNPIQETVFKHKLTFIAAAKQVPSLPPLQYPEVAFAGVKKILVNVRSNCSGPQVDFYAVSVIASRSNVGKSSLINALSRRWGVARTSEKPGLTQSINFFTLGSQLCLVDLPGYGFAYAKEEKKEDWEELVKYYVQTRTNLKRVCLLVDAKWGLKPRDEELLHLMESAGTPFQVVLTKTDVLPPIDLARRATQILQVLDNHRCLIRPMMMVSSKTGAGIQPFRASLARIALNQSRMLQDDSA